MSLWHRTDDVNNIKILYVSLGPIVLPSVARHEKGLLKEHKIAAEKIGMIKVRDLRGALATDMEMRNLLETNIQKNEIVLTDLESRQVTAVDSHPEWSTPEPRL